MKSQYVENIDVVLEESLLIGGDLYIIDPQVSQEIELIINRATEVKNARDKLRNIKAAKARSIENTIIALLESPEGLTKAGLLSAADFQNFLSLSVCIHNYLKKQNLYTLKKRKSDGEMHYFLDPIR